MTKVNAAGPMILVIVMAVLLILASIYGIPNILQEIKVENMMDNIEEEIKSSWSPRK